MAPGSRPNPRVRRDWERTRAQFERDRAQRITDAHAARAVESASLSFPATPVASTSARRFREAYLTRVESDADFITPPDFAETRGAETASVFALLPGLLLAYWVLSTTIAAPFATNATIIWSAAQLVFYFLVWLFVVVAPFQAIGSRLAVRRYRAHAADAEAYARWSESVTTPDPAP